MPVDAPKLRGFTCPHCRGVRLFVWNTRNPARNLVRRYRQCVECGYRLVTEERARPIQPPKKK